MEISDSRSAPRIEALIAVGGPVAAGAAAGFGQGLGVTLTDSLRLPVVMLLTAALTLPALWVAAAVIGSGPRLGAFAAASLSSLREAGTLLLGFSPALLFLSATTAGADDSTLAVLALAVLVGLRGLFLRLRGSVAMNAGAQAVFAGWALMSGFLGLLLITR